MLKLVGAAIPAALVLIIVWSNPVQAIQQAVQGLVRPAPAVTVVAPVPPVVITATSVLEDISAEDIIKRGNQPAPLPNPIPLPVPLPIPDKDKLQPTVDVTEDPDECPTNAPPGSYTPFDRAREMEDLMCNVRKYTGITGPQPYIW